MRAARATGLLGVGVGEVVLPQLVRSCCMPLPLAAELLVLLVELLVVAGQGDDRSLEF